jgi:alpha-maltose-1-phosphate synthase
MGAVVYFQDDGFMPLDGRRVGRPVSGQGLLRALARESAPDPLLLTGPTSDQFDHFLTLDSQVSILQPDQPVQWLEGIADPAMTQTGTLYIHGVGLLADYAWQRRKLQPHGFSLCGVHHTFSTHDMLDTLTGLLTAPVRPFDALICTSTAARQAITGLLDEQADYLAQRFRAGSAALHIERPVTPVIPLGIECDRFRPDRVETADWRSDWRRRLSIADDAVVLLSFGRLSYTGKAHPLPLFLALAESARRLTSPLHLVAAGWFANQAVANDFARAAALVCPQVTVHWLDGNDPEVRDTIWAAADLFVSLSDTIQETFGLTPVEAMASGLPAIVSDWNGYRDTVIHGETGFRIPTLAPAPGQGTVLAEWYENGLLGPDLYEGFAALATAVDLDSLVTAIVALAGSAELRRQMGAVGIRRARMIYDWAAVVPQLQDLWSELAAIRRLTPPLPAGVRPGRRDPFEQFGGYPTRHLDLNSRLSLSARAEAGGPALLSALQSLEMSVYGGEAFGLNDLARSLLSVLGREPLALAGLTVDMAEQDRQRLVWTACLLVKFGLVQVMDGAAC